MLNNCGLRFLRAMAMLVAVTCSDDARAIDFGSGALPLRYVSATGVALEADHEVKIIGEVHAPAPVAVVLRIDDGASHDYASRYNEERMLPPGPFEWTVPANGMTTSSGRVLAQRDLRRFYFFAATPGTARIYVSQFASSEAPKLPAGAVGYALGRRDAPLPPGFERIAPGDLRIRGVRPTAVRRPAPDPLVANGIRGIEGLKLPWALPRARVTIWSEDPGEWELLPQMLQQRLRINGRDVAARSLTAGEWIKERYLSGAGIEHLPTDDAWSAFGSRRGGMITTVADTLDDAIDIEIAGTPQALFLNAVLIEPETSTAGLEHVNAWRQKWYRQMWPVVEAKDHSGAPPTDVVLARDERGTSTAPVTKASAAGTGVRFRFRVLSDVTIREPEVVVDPPQLGGQAASVRVWAGQSRLERRRANDTSLVYADNLLAGDVKRLALPASTARIYEVWVGVPSNAAPGLWRGSFAIGEAGRVVTVPLTIDVLAHKLPPAVKPAGFYLDEAPHLTWFSEMRGKRGRQIACDLALMKSFGVHGSAPALAMPASGNGDFESDMTLAREADVASPWLAYAPAKRMAAQYGLRGSARRLADLQEAIGRGGDAAPIWSVADEPSNPGHSSFDLNEWLREIRAASSSIVLAAHLNTPSDAGFARQFDVALVNDGFGLELASLQKVRREVKELWLYNTARPRATAGLWLWLSPASRYIQWHGRMPTADPYDPTDGREGDVQVIFPSSEACPAQPDIHRDLLDMAEGLVDQRWFGWLSEQDGSDAQRMAEAIRSQFGSWEKVRGLGGRELAAIRESIIEFAESRGRR